MARMVKVRIKRMGKQWASCGIPVSPPENMRSNPGIKRLCPKLVPGQVIEVPDTHNLLNQDCVEIVRRLEPDEFLRPWVFRSAEDATMANPTKSRMGAQAIANGLNLAEGAQAKGQAKLAEREENRRRALLDDEQQGRDAGEDDDFYEAAPKPRRRARDEDDQDDDAAEDARLEAEEDAYVPNPQNRVSPDEAEKLRGEDDEAEEPAPARGRGRSRPAADTARQPRSRRG